MKRAPEPAVRPAVPATVRVRRVEGAPVVSVRVFIRGGSRAEPVPGLALVTGRLLAEGTAERDWRQVADDAEARGMSLGGFASLDGHGVAIDALAREWRLALEWARELTFEPAFDPERTAWVARQASGELESLLDAPEVHVGYAFLDHLYHPHPRGRPLQGDAASLASLTAAKCRRFHRTALARGLVVAVAGEIDPREVEEAVRTVFPVAAAAGSVEPATTSLDAPGRPESRREVECPGRDQAHLFLGHPTVERGHPEYAALEILGVILGGGAGLDGRLPRRIREREGLAYSVQVGTVLGAGREPGHLGVWVATAEATLERALECAVEELARVAAEGAEVTELEAARSWLLGREPFSRETARQWAARMVRAQISGLPLDRPEWRTAAWRRVTPEDLAAAARRWIRPGELKVTVGRPIGAVRA